MEEIGIDLGRSVPRRLSDEVAAEPAVLVTMGCGENCPLVPRLKFIERSIVDTKGKPVETIRQNWDQIHEQVRELIKGDCARCCRGLDTTAPSSVEVTGAQ